MSLGFSADIAMASGDSFSAMSFAKYRRRRSCLESEETGAFPPQCLEHFFRHLNAGAQRRIRRIHYVEQKRGVQRFVESRPE